MTDETRNMCILVHDGPATEIPGNLVEFIAWFDKHLQTIPEEHRKSTLVAIEDGDDDWEYPGHISIYYFRPETGSEHAARIASNERQREKERAE